MSKPAWLKSEDWWTVIFGMFILGLATVLGILALYQSISAQQVPKLGKWVSNPGDIFYKAKKVKVATDAKTSLKDLAAAINKKTNAVNAQIVKSENGFRLQLTSTRKEKSATISLSTLLEGGQVKLAFEPKEPDPDGLGVRSYLSQELLSDDVLVGAGKITLVLQRDKFIFWPLVLSLLAMALLTAIGIKFMGQSPTKYVLGFIVVCLFSILSFGFANFHISKAYGLSYAAWALVIGLLISNTIGTPKWLMAAVKTEMYIKTGLVLLGAEILFGKILKIGVPGLMVAWLVTPTVIIFMWLYGTRILKMVSKPLVMIIAAATSVCGVSAAIAVAAASRAKKEELTLAVGMTLIFTVLMMIFMPMFIHAMGMSPILGGAWMGGTIDSTGAVVAAGAFLGPNAETVAAVVKMIQNVLIGVVGFGVALFWITSVERDPNAPRPGLGEIWVRFPKFIVGFVAASIIFSFILTPLFSWLFAGDGLKLVESAVIKSFTNPLRGWFFCLAFVSIGLESNFKELAKQMEGGKPMVLYVIGQSFNLILTLAIAWLAFMVLFPDAV
jgi:uncharacterized integral membrane protein (TIGR00698 family)